MGTLHHLPTRPRATPVILTKRQLAAHPLVCRSARWIELRTKEGMPSTLDRGKRMYPLVECLAWLESQKKGAA
jgi:hypothetical protein